MASEKNILSFAPPPVQTLTIHSATVHVVITCRCGSPVPIMVLFVPGLPLQAFCPACQLKFKLARFIFDVERDGQVNVGVSETEPTIVTPTPSVM